MSIEVNVDGVPMLWCESIDALRAVLGPRGLTVDDVNKIVMAKWNQLLDRVVDLETQVKNLTPPEISPQERAEASGREAATHIALAPSNAGQRPATLAALKRMSSKALTAERQAAVLYGREEYAVAIKKIEHRRRLATERQTPAGRRPGTRPARRAAATRRAKKGR